MRISLQAGHGLTPPRPYCYPRKSKLTRWHYQRGEMDLQGTSAEHFGTEEGRRFREDLYTARFCGLLIPELVAQGHEVYPLRAMDPVTGQLDTRRMMVTPRLLPKLSIDDAQLEQRWKFCAGVADAVRARKTGRDVCPPWRWKLGGSFDPVAPLWAERRFAESELYLSIHVNAYNTPAHGFTVWHQTRAARPAAMAILDSVNAEFGRGTAREHRLVDRRYQLMRDHFWETSRSGPPAVIVELGFMTDPEDLAALTKRVVAERLATSIAAGVE